MALRFTLKAAPPGRVNCAPLVPEALAGKGVPEIAALRLECGSETIAVGELFSVAGDDASDIVFEGGSSRLDRIGAGMKAGRIAVRGDGGAFLGQGMRGGSVEVEGGAGAWCGNGMRAGLVQVRGSVGDFLAAALPGEHRGLQGGVVVVGGNAGDRAGDRMRRGMVLVEGDCGSYCGSRMGAGTIAVLGATGANAGFAMRRGTLLLRGAPSMLATFDDAGMHSLGFLRLMFRAWRNLPSRFASIGDDAARVRRYVGDRGNGGLGEILVW